MVTQIGIVAGEIWNFLDEHGETTLDEIIKNIDKSEKLILMSLGWLAREKHIIVTEKNNIYRINLTQTKMKKGAILVIVFGVLIVLSLLAVTAINLMRQQSKITEHKISRQKKMLAAQAGMVHALEELRKGNNPSGNGVFNINGLSVDIRYIRNGSGPNGTNPVIITVD